MTVVKAEDTIDRDIPALISDLYERAPVSARAKLLEHLLRPVGPLAMMAIAAGAFARFAYRLRRDAVPISLEDAARITSGHVLHLARYVEQSSPAVLHQIGVLIANRSLDLATVGGSALLIALSIWRVANALRYASAAPSTAPA